MPKLKADELLDRCTEAANAVDIEGISALYEKDAAFFLNLGSDLRALKKFGPHWYLGLP